MFIDTQHLLKGIPDISTILPPEHPKLFQVHNLLLSIRGGGTIGTKTNCSILEKAIDAIHLTLSVPINCKTLSFLHLISHTNPWSVL